MSKKPTIQTDNLATVVPKSPDGTEPNDIDATVPPTGYGLAAMEFLRGRSTTVK